MKALALAGAVLVAATGAEGAPEPFVPDDVYRLTSLSSPQLSPDGTRALVVVRSADREHDRWARRLDTVDVGNGTRRTIALPVETFSSPRWSPSGDRIAFLSGGAVWIAGSDGADAQRASTAGLDVVQFSWRPDGKALALIALDRPPPATGDARYLDAYQVGNDAALAAGRRPAARVYLQPLEGGPVRFLAPLAGSAASGDAESTLSWSPDGATLAYLHAPTNIGNDAVDARVHLIDVATGRDRPMPGPAGHERDPLFSPNGFLITYTYSAGDDQLHPVELFVAAARGGTAANISHVLDRAVRDVAWEPASRTVWFTATSGTKHVLYRSANGASPRALDLGPLSISSGLDGAIAAGGTIAFVAQTAQRPDELYVLPPGGAPRRLTSYNDAIASRALATTTRITYRTSAGVDGDAVLTKPPAFRRGMRYPLVVVIHGGPTSASLETFDALDQLLAARGWLVLEPNYRGSNNLGARYQRAVGGDKLRGPGRDVGAAIDAVRRLGIVDGTRLAVSGWSYGAGLTLWMIEQRHDWRAAVAGAAVTDIAADYATADDIAADRALVGGSPLIAPYRAKAAAMSPIAYAARVRTPLLLMTCRGDTRVSPVGTYEFYHALRDLGRDVHLVAYPVDGHFPSDPVRRIDVYRRWVGFIADRFAP
jgi:dipeptidyl aminopeptidase/acylaminoacyl peptidase